MPETTKLRRRGRLLAAEPDVRARETFVPLPEGLGGRAAAQALAERRRRDYEQGCRSVLGFAWLVVSSAANGGPQP